MGWSKERLEDVAQTRLGGAKLIVVANREPYIHRYRDGEIEWIRPAGGLTTALDPVMRACGGVWVAHGSGDADAEVVRRARPRRASRRTTRATCSAACGSSKDEEEGYYYGFANSTLWPLCHQVFCRPTFDPAHWDAYRKVNETFAAAVLEEAQGGPALVFVQDYHFALLPAAAEGRAAGPGGGAVLAHPLAEPGDVPRLPVGEGPARRHARQRPARVPHPVPLQQLPGDGGPHAGVPHRPRAVRGHPRRARDAASARSRSASIPDLADGVPRRRLGAPGRGAAQEAPARRPAAARRRRPRRLHEGHPGAAAGGRPAAATSTRN